MTVTEDYVYVFIGLFVMGIDLFKRELLIRKDSFRLVFLVSFILFLTGLMLHFTDVGRYSSSGALLGPLISLALFRLYRKWFVKRFNREPKDTSFNWESGLFWDRLFNIVFGVSGTLLIMLMAALMYELAKVGL